MMQKIGQFYKVHNFINYDPSKGSIKSEFINQIS